MSTRNAISVQFPFLNHYAQGIDFFFFYYHNSEGVSYSIKESKFNFKICTKRDFSCMPSFDSIHASFLLKFPSLLKTWGSMNISITGAEEFLTPTFRRHVPSRA